MNPTDRLHLTRPAAVWAASAGLLTLIGWFKGINLMLLLGDFLIALLALNAVLARRSARTLSAARRELGPVFAGEPVLESVTVVAAERPLGAVLVADPTGEPPLSWLLSPAPSAGPAVLRGERTYPKRGRIDLAPLTVESAYPLGLVRCVRRAGEPGELVVLQAVGPVGIDELRRFLLRASSGDGRSRRPSRRFAPGQGDLRGVRPYRPGDSPRDVHWRSTARRNQLVVREYDQTDPLHVILILDPWLPESSSPEQVSALEWTMSLTASVAWSWATADEPGDLALVLPGAGDSSPARATVGAVRRILTPLADLRGLENVPTPGPASLKPFAPRTARLVVSSRQGSPLLAAIRARGLPAAGVDPGQPLRWYLPPGDAAR